MKVYSYLHAILLFIPGKLASRYASYKNRGGKELLMRFQKLKGSSGINFLLLLSVIMTLSIIPLKLHAFPPYSKQGDGLWVSAICDQGLLKGTDINIYLLQKDDFYEYRKGGKIDEKKYVHKGISPVHIRNIEPGEYYLGAEIIIDDAVIKPEGDQKDYRPKPENFFADDVPNMWSFGIKFITVNGETRFATSWIKWYKVTLQKDKVSPVIPLFLSKKSSIQDWLSVYPKQDQFDISVDNKFLSELWNFGINGVKSPISSCGLKVFII